MMMMSFGGMMNAGGMGMQNPYMMQQPMGMQGNPAMMQQQQMAMQQQRPRVGASQFPPPVEGNPYQAKKKDNSFKLPPLTLPNADWGDVAYNSALALGAGAVVGAGLGALENYNLAPDKGIEFDIRTGASVEPTHHQQISPHNEMRTMASSSRVTSVDGKMAASIEFNYRNQALLQNVPLVKHLPFTGKNKAREIESIEFKIKNGTKPPVQAVLQREGLRKQDFRLKIQGDASEVIYRQSPQGKFIPHKVIEEGTTHHLSGRGASPDYSPVDYTLTKMLGGVPEEAIKTKMPLEASGRKLLGKTHVPWAGGRFNSYVAGIAALSALAVGGFTVWKTSQPKSSEELLKTLPTQRQLPLANTQPPMPPAMQQQPTQQAFNAQQQGQRLNYGV